MRKTTFLACIFTFFFLLFLPCFAHAHLPYVIKLKTMQGPGGETVYLEKLVGDGIVVSDPVSLQVRNGHGALLAYTPKTHGEIYLHCPNLEHCYTLLHDRGWLGQPYQLDYRHLDYQNTSLTLLGRMPPLKEERQAMLDYLQDPHIIYSKHSYQYSDPVGRKKAMGFINGPPELARQTPLFVLKYHWRALSFLFGLCFFPFIIRFYLNHNKPKNMGPVEFSACKSVITIIPISFALLSALLGIGGLSQEYTRLIILLSVGLGICLVCLKPRQIVDQPKQ